MKYICHRKGFKSYKASGTIIKPHCKNRTFGKCPNIWKYNTVSSPIYLWEMFWDPSGCLIYYSFPIYTHLWQSLLPTRNSVSPGSVGDLASKKSSGEWYPVSTSVLHMPIHRHVRLHTHVHTRLITPHLGEAMEQGKLLSTVVRNVQL